MGLPSGPTVSKVGALSESTGNLWIFLKAFSHFSLWIQGLPEARHLIFFFFLIPHSLKDQPGISTGGKKSLALSLGLAFGLSLLIKGIVLDKTSNIRNEEGGWERKKGEREIRGRKEGKIREKRKVENKQADSGYEGQDVEKIIPTSGGHFKEAKY